MTIEVLTRQTCSACTGEKYTIPPEWTEWQAARDAWEAAFWVDHPRPLPNPYLYSYEARAWEGEHPSPNVPEEIPCPACQGTGAEERWMPLADVLASVEVTS